MNSKLPMYIALVKVDYYSKKGKNKYFELTEEYKMWVKGFSLKECAENIRDSKIEKNNLTHTISDIKLISFATFAVRS